MNSHIGAGLATGGKAISLSFALLLTYRFLQWAAAFIAGRLDARQAAVSAKEELVDGKVIARLKKLEEHVGRLEKATTILIAEVRASNPNSPKLALVHGILDGSIPLETETPPDMLDIVRNAK